MNDRMKLKERLMQIIFALQNSEKSNYLAENYRQYVFKVKKDANKIEIKQAVELIFDKVKVDKVRVCIVKGKRKIYKRIRGKKQDWKKAFVTLKHGHEINLTGIVHN